MRSSAMAPANCEPPLLVGALFQPMLSVEAEAGGSTIVLFC